EIKVVKKSKNVIASPCFWHPRGPLCRRHPRHFSDATSNPITPRDVNCHALSGRSRHPWLRRFLGICHRWGLGWEVVAVALVCGSPPLVLDSTQDYLLGLVGGDRLVQAGAEAILVHYPL
ncbi:unnamed protein product, partial [Musa acuminata subsp. burmannicoides]